MFSPNQIGSMHVASLTLTGSTDQRCLPSCLLSQGKDVIAEQGEVGEKPSGMCRTDTVTRTDVYLSEKHSCSENKLQTFHKLKRDLQHKKPHIIQLQP